MAHDPHRSNHPDHRASLLAPFPDVTINAQFPTLEVQAKAIFRIEENHTGVENRTPLEKTNSPVQAFKHSNFKPDPDPPSLTERIPACSGYEIISISIRSAECIVHVKEYRLEKVRFW